MNTNKKLTSAIAVVILVALTACSNSSQNPVENSPATTVTTCAESQDQSIPKADGNYAKQPQQLETTIKDTFSYPQKTEEATLADVEMDLDCDTIMNITDDEIEKIIQLMPIATTLDFIPDYYHSQGFYYPSILEKGTDFDGYCNSENASPARHTDFENHVITKVDENEFYTHMTYTYTEIRSMYRNDDLVESHIDRWNSFLYLKDFESVENDSFYIGEKSAKNVQINFDLLTSNGLKLCRRVLENEDSFIYEYCDTYISYGDYGLMDTLHINKTQIEISKADGTYSYSETQIYEGDIPGTYHEQP